jgi:SsrA-binding protein
MKINIKNKKAFFKFEILDTFTVGIVLQGTEIKSIRASNLSFNDSYCYFNNNELFLKNFHISEYEQGTYNNHEPLRERKLLLTKKELRKLNEKVTEKGLTIVPLRIFINEKGFVKFDIGLARGKKDFDKRNTIKERDIDRDNNLS